ncbi:MAG: hypothetical protein J3K34DRAFT_447252, partial [Monoraphidium minutum]
MRIQRRHMQHLAALACVYVFWQCVSTASFSSHTDIRRGVSLVSSWTSRLPPCPEVDYVFTREFFLSSEQRTRELLTSSELSMKNNTCAVFRFIITNMQAAPMLQALHTRTNVATEVYYYCGDVTMDKIFEVAAMPVTGRASSLFVVSTGDVVLPRLTHLYRVCQPVFVGPQAQLMVMSRVGSATEGCEVAKNAGGFDVYIGNSSFITQRVLQSIRIAPNYMGIETFVSAVVTNNKATLIYNLCPQLSVWHFHSSSGTNPFRRPRVNHPENNALPAGALSAVCNVASLQMSKRL